MNIQCPTCKRPYMISRNEIGLDVPCDKIGCNATISTRHLVAVAALIPATSAVLEPNATAPPDEPFTPHPTPYLPFTDRPRYNTTSSHHDPAAPGGHETRLTGPYSCHACKGLIHRPQGQRHATFTHCDLLRPEPCHTSTYAAVYHCPKCRVMLESPKSQWGLPVSCPACREQYPAPYDILHRHEGDAAFATFTFPCPSCARPLRADMVRDHEATVGTRVVCLGCRHIITIPSSGAPCQHHAIGMGPMQALRQSPLRRCKGCKQLAPASASVCPVCGYPEADAIALD